VWAFQGSGFWEFEVLGSRVQGGLAFEVWG